MPMGKSLQIKTDHWSLWQNDDQSLKCVPIPNTINWGNGEYGGKKVNIWNPNNASNHRANKIGRPILSIFLTK